MRKPTNPTEVQKSHAEYSARVRKERIASGLCSQCGRNKPRIGLKQCEECGNKHKAIPKVRMKKYRADRTAFYQEAVFAHYGRVCVCCGESEPLCLTLDHINNDGKKQRLTSHNDTWYYAARDKPDDLQILCYNCNFGKAKNGGICPHKAKKND